MQTTTICSQCGASISFDQRFCHGCGAMIVQPERNAWAETSPTYHLESRPLYNKPELTKDEKNWAMFCHLSAMLVYIFPYAHIIAPLILWLLKKDTSHFVDDQGKECLNYNISIMIYLTIAGIFSCIYIGIPFLIGLAMFDFIIMIVAAVRASNGEYYRYPITIRFIK